MKKKISIIIAVIVIIALIAAAAIFHYLSNRTHFNEGYVNGNTAGNLYNGGLFCEYDGTVYFSNPSDGGKLYSMSPDCMVVLVRVQMYLPETHCGAVVCHPVFGASVRETPCAYSTSTDAMTASATAMSLPSSLAPGPRWNSLASRFQ